MSRNMMVCSSITLQTTHVRETSLYLAESFLSPFLHIRQTFPFSQSSGRSCSVSDWLNMTVKYGEIWGAHPFRACDSILSEPLSFKELTFFRRSCAFGSYGEFRRSGLVKVWGHIAHLWAVKTPSYRLLRISAFPLAFDTSSFLVLSFNVAIYAGIFSFQWLDVQTNRPFTMHSPLWQKNSPLNFIMADNLNILWLQLALRLRENVVSIKIMVKYRIYSNKRPASN